MNRLLQITPHDMVAVALEPLKAGESVSYGTGEDGTPLMEIPWITTNFTAQWCLKAIVTAEFIPESRPGTLAELERELRENPPEYRMYGA